MISQYLKHKPECAIKQNWDEARQALADTPNQFRDADYYIACEELEKKARTCTCKLDTLKPRIVLLPEDITNNKELRTEIMRKHLKIVKESEEEGIEVMFAYHQAMEEYAQAVMLYERERLKPYLRHKYECRIEVPIGGSKMIPYDEKGLRCTCGLETDLPLPASPKSEGG